MASCKTTEEWRAAGRQKRACVAGSTLAKPLRIAPSDSEPNSSAARATMSATWDMPRGVAIVRPGRLR